MVNVRGIDSEKIHFKLKKGRTKGLLKEVFGKEFVVDEFLDNLYVRKKPSLFNYFSMSWPKSFLTIDLNLDKNSFKLIDEKYFDKTIEFAENYEKYFGVEVNLVTDYSR